MLKFKSKKVKLAGLIAEKEEILRQIDWSKVVTGSQRQRLTKLSRKIGELREITGRELK